MTRSAGRIVTRLLGLRFAGMGADMVLERRVRSVSDSGLERRPSKSGVWGDAEDEGTMSPC